MTTTQPRALVAVAGTVLIIGALSACSKSGDSSPAPESGTASTAAGSSVPTSMAGGRQLFASDFMPVCQGVGVSRAADYGASAPGRKVILFSPYKGSPVEDSSALPEDWMVRFDANSDEYAKVSVVACVQLKSEQHIKDCTGYQDKGKETSNKVDLRSATYTVTAHEAKTGKTLGTTELSSTDDSCPMFMTFNNDTESITYDASPSNEDLIAFLKPYVQA